MKTVKDQVWAYLHGELAGPERAAFEQALQQDQELATELEECRALHRDLAELGDRQLEEQLLSEWESDNPEYQERKYRPGSRMIRLFVPLAAAAAALFILMLLPAQNGPIHWQRTVYGPPPQVRGTLNQQPVYRNTDLERISGTLQTAVETRLKQREPSPEPWTLQIHLQELAQGYLAVEISGAPEGKSKQSVTWSETLQGGTKMDAEIEAFAARIATEMAQQESP